MDRTDLTDRADGLAAGCGLAGGVRGAGPRGGWARWLLGVALGGCVAGGVVSLALSVQPSAVAQARPAGVSGAVAVVDLNRVLSQLDEQRDQSAVLKVLEGEQKQIIENLTKQIGDLRAELDVLPDGTERRRIIEQLARLEVREQTERRFSQLLMDDRARVILGELFGKIQAAVADYAQREGYALVVSTDSGARIPQGLTLQQTDLFISGRRVLHASSAIDISDQITALMNNSYRMRNAAP